VLSDAAAKGPSETVLDWKAAGAPHWWSKPAPDWNSEATCGGWLKPRMNPRPKRRSTTALAKHHSGSEIKCCSEEPPHSRVAWHGEPEVGMNPAEKCCCGGRRFQASSCPASMSMAAVREDNEKSGVVGLLDASRSASTTMSGAMVWDKERRSEPEKRGEERWS
jgi:hypothetical protein